MTAASRTNWVLVIVAIGGTVVSIISAWRNGAKIEEVKVLADGNLTRVSAELKTANELAAKNADRVEALERLLVSGTKPAEVKVINDPASPVPTTIKKP